MRKIRKKFLKVNNNKKKESTFIEKGNKQHDLF